MALPAYKLYGSDGSPYSCKVRAALRFLRIAYEWIPVFQVAAHSTHSGELFSKHFPDIKTKVIPVLVRPDGTHLAVFQQASVVPWVHYVFVYRRNWC